MSYLISGFNAVRESLRKGNSIVEILVAKQKKIHRIQEILDMAEKNRVPVTFKDKAYIDSTMPNSSHQGIVALLKSYKYFRLDELVKFVAESNGNGLLLASDHITDAGNLGALIRTAEFFGVQGLILPKDRSATINDIVHKTSAGGSAHLPVTRVVNLSRALDELVENDVWIIGASGESKTSIYEFDWKRNVAVVMGNEEKGLARNVRGRCDHLVSIPGFGKIDSLNVSVASGVIFSEIIRQRNFCK